MKHTEILSVGHIDLGSTEFTADINPTSMAVLPTRNIVLFPGVVFPITLVRESSRKVAEFAAAHNQAVAVMCQKSDDIEDPAVSDLRPLGVPAQVLKVIPLPDNTALALVRGANVKLEVIDEAQGPGPGLYISCRLIKEKALRKSAASITRLQVARDMTREMLSHSSGPVSGIADMSDKDAAERPSVLINSLCAIAPININDRYALLETDSQTERLKMLAEALAKSTEAFKIRAEIEDGARRRLNERQRNAVLEAEMEHIREELYGEDNEVSTLTKKLEKLKIKADTRRNIERVIGKLERMNPQSPEFQTHYDYLETVLELPWNVRTKDSTDFAEAEAKLNSSHSGLEKVKERVLEQLAMMIHSPKSHSPIICLVGPPGVGKTSLGQSIADALGRKFRRVSLGGLHDESEIRGHRRTYIGAMPGRIIDAVRRSGSSNPVIMLDEIDKVGQDYKGDPAAALLEVLDPEQNVRFHDNYIDLDFDLSGVMFITTANSLSPISAPLLDRMEVIELSGYSQDEKVEIAVEHLLPQLHKQMGLEEGEAEIPPRTIAAVIENYTAESGVRQLQKHMATLLRKYVRAKVSHKPLELPIEPEHLHELLGVETMSRDKFGTDNLPGVVTGLAWTSAGGEILFIESVLTDGKGDGLLTLTGNLGDVMKESAAISHRYVRAHAAEFGISDEQLRKDVHIHVPEGAIPKDGPSAGVTMTTAIVSAMTGRPVRPHVAMTGEMTLRGKVLPVGGIKEKILAAKRAGVREIILSADNRRHIEDIKSKYIEGLTFHYVTSVSEVIDLALA